MSVIDTDQLLEEISPESPCGDNLEYDPLYGEMERATQGKPEEEIGETRREAEPPNWREVKSKGLELLTRTKDLRVVAHLARAVLHTDNLPAFCESMALVRGYVEQYWDTVHPQLDPEDNNDPTERVNTIESLSDSEKTLRFLRETPLVSSRVLGRFSLRDIDIAKGDLPPPADGEPPQMSAIEAAFMDCELEDLKGHADAVDQAIDHVKAIETAVTNQVGVGNAASLDKLATVLQGAQRIFSEQLARRGVTHTSTAARDGENINDDGATGQAQPLSGEISSRDDVIRALDKVCAYYERHEPSSPVPLLLKRAKRLASKNFLEIIRDLTPEAVSQAELIGGVDKEE